MEKKIEFTEKELAHKLQMFTVMIVMRIMVIKKDDRGGLIEEILKETAQSIFHIDASLNRPD